jgi:hypothetical protein
VDTSNADVQAYLKLIHTRNDLLHGNINIERLKFNELYFNDKVPVFKSYTSMWERSLGVSHRAVGLEEVHAELDVVDAFIEYLLSILSDKIAEEMRLIGKKFDLGVSKKTGRLGLLFGERLVDFGMPKDQPDADTKTLHIRTIVDSPLPDGQATPDAAAIGPGADSAPATSVKSDARTGPVARAESDVQIPASDIDSAEQHGSDLP